MDLLLRSGSCSFPPWLSALFSLITLTEIPLPSMMSESWQTLTRCLWTQNHCQYYLPTSALSIAMFLLSSYHCSHTSFSFSMKSVHTLHKLIADGQSSFFKFKTLSIKFLLIKYYLPTPVISFVSSLSWCLVCIFFNLNISQLHFHMKRCPFYPQHSYPSKFLEVSN